MSVPKIRIGKDIAITMSVKTNGESVSLEGRDISVVLKTPMCEQINMEFTVSGNTITTKHYGTKQKYCGVYMLTVWENYGKIGQTVLDFCNAFELVSSTCKEVPSFEGIETGTVDLEGDLNVGIRGASAYEVALNNGFECTEEEWLASLKGKDFSYEDFTPEQILELQKPAVEAALSASEATNQALIATKNANNATQSATQVTEEARQATSKAEQASQTANATNESVTKAEEDRMLAENQRVSAEDAREQAEAEREATFTTLQGQIEEAVENANGAVTTAEGILQTAQQANSLAQGAVESANQATQEANQATANANAATESITTLEASIESAETKRVSAENSRVSAEQQREQAETSRKQAESGRITAEQGRVSAESGRVAAESGRASAEQQRVTEFATLKQDAETATANANEAAEKANEAAEGIESNLFNSEKYGTYTVINNDSSQKNYFSKDKIIFNSKPTVSSCVYFDKNGNHYDLPILGFGTEQKKPYQCKSYIGFYCEGYFFKFLHIEEGIVKAQKTYGDIRQPILNGVTFNMLTKIFASIDIFGKVALLFGYTVTEGIVELCREPIENVSDIFKESYIIIGTRDYTSKIYNIYISLNFPISYKSFLTEDIYIGNYNIGKRYKYNQYANSPIVGNGTVYAESGTVRYEEQSTGHCIANVEGLDGRYGTFAGEVTNVPSGLIGSSFTVRFKILSGECTLAPGTSEIYQITDDHDFVRINKLVCDTNKEYTLVYSNSGNDHAYSRRYSTKMSGTFKVEILDVKAYFAQSQICCMETYNGTFFTGNIPMSCNPSNISYNTPAVVINTPQEILGQIYIGAENAFITLKDSSGKFVYKKITP